MMRSISSKLQCTCKINSIRKQSFSTTFKISSTLSERLAARLATKSTEGIKDRDVAPELIKVKPLDDVPAPYSPSKPIKKIKQQYPTTPLGKLVSTAIEALSKDKPPQNKLGFKYNQSHTKSRPNLFIEESSRSLREMNGRSRAPVLNQRQRDIKSAEEKEVLKVVAARSATEPFYNRLPGQAARGSNSRKKIRTQLSNDLQISTELDQSRRLNARYPVDELMPAWSYLPLRVRQLFVANTIKAKEAKRNSEAKLKFARDLVETKKLIEVKALPGFENAVEASSNTKFQWQYEQEKEKALAASRFKRDSAKDLEEVDHSIPESATRSEIFASLVSDIGKISPIKANSANIPSQSTTSPNIAVKNLKSIPTPKITLSYLVGNYVSGRRSDQDDIDSARLRYEERRRTHNAAAQILQKEQEAKSLQPSIPNLVGSIPPASRLPPPSIANFLARTAAKATESAESAVPSPEISLTAEERTNKFEIRKAVGIEEKKLRHAVAAVKRAEEENDTVKVEELNSFVKTKDKTSPPSTPPRPKTVNLSKIDLNPPRSEYTNFVSPISVIPTRIFPPFPPVPVAKLSHGLDRVLFNPGVHFLQDPRSGVYNFDPILLENIPSLDKFDFEKLPTYITSSKDDTLKQMAKDEDKLFVGSTSSTVGMLCQIYYWMSKGKQANMRMLTDTYGKALSNFTFGQTVPVSIVMNEQDGKYSIDADKSYEPPVENILASYGHLMEKLLTSDEATFKGFLIDSESPAKSEADTKQAYHYVKTDHMILRSQLDAHNEYLPRVSFDVKTRGTAAIRQDRLNHKEGSEYYISKLHGSYESYEKEYYDLIRSAFLKYQFQARIGNMDGCIVAFHNTMKFFGFQYIPIEEMDIALFGSTSEGNAIFPVCVALLEKILLEAKDCFPNQSLNLTFAAVQNGEPLLRVFVEPRDGENKSIALLELQGTNYLDGAPTYKLNFAEYERKGQKIPAWDFGYKITRQHPTGPKLPKPFSKTIQSIKLPPRKVLTIIQIRSLFQLARKEQLSFNTITLPSDVSLGDLEAATARSKAVESQDSSASTSTIIDDSNTSPVNENETIISSISEELEPTVEELVAASVEDDLILTNRFPMLRGITYTENASSTQSLLRKIARSSKEARAKLGVDKDGKKVVIRSQFETL